ncbi:dephospho-CoA kinase [Phyllobacterium salinisoli]|uniref:Dephospho-CoA kinase n=1 Tax=Phyllobacterium salinisoli TaxID=1899321 RepID=A0A368JZK5_9HYPH|nr:dephospho-CoA kinase [Phyllobacterium salinisoli]RCS22344.1 dephospho-CoA kinase [Phyllobacterium salinisoli]
MIILGLTGSIGMGKTTTAQMFADAGIPVYSADEAVHRLYSGRAVPLIEAAFPGTTREHAVDRQKLSAAVLGQPDAMKKLEAIVHPLVRQEEQAFLENAGKAGADIAVLDIPLLLETGGEERVDRIVVVSAPPEVQRQRVLAREGMNSAKFDAILASQMADAEKRMRADFIVDTGSGLAAARHQVAAIIRQLREEAAG